MNTLYHHLWPLLLAFSHPESASSIVAGLCPQFKHWHLWIFLHAQCHGQVFLRGAIFGFPHSCMTSTLRQAEGDCFFLMGGFVFCQGVWKSLRPISWPWLIKPTHFNLPREAVPGNSWVTMKCKWDWSCSSISSCEFPGFGTSAACSQLLICRSSWALGLAWGWLPCRERFLNMLLWHS